MKFPWTVKKKVSTPAEEQIEKIKAILFPPLEIQQEMQADGTPIKFHVDYSADSNLDAALIDLQEGYNDPAAHKTILDVVKRLSKIRKMLEVYIELDKDAKYIIVENLEQDKEIIASDQ
jgi:hypothetical protein